MSFLSIYFHYLIETLYESRFDYMRLFKACMSCCFESSSVILSVKLLVVKRKILCYAGEGQASSPDTTLLKNYSFQSPALLALKYIEID